MNIVIDILAAIILLFFFLAGWHKGALLSSLGIVRVILSYSAAYFSGRYLGYWLGEALHRPRIITIPVVAGLVFVIITFVFHVVMTNIRDEHLEKEEKEDFRRPVLSCIGGSIINLFAGGLSLIFLFWLGDLFLAGTTGQPIPGASKAQFGRFARRTVYETTYRIASFDGNASQAAALGRMISNPARGLVHLEQVLDADSVQALLKDTTFTEALLSGDPERIKQNASLQQLFGDRSTLDEMRELGLLSGKEKKSELYQKLASFGGNETIQASLENLKQKELLETDKILLLIRDPDFDIIVGELLK